MFPFPFIMPWGGSCFDELCTPPLQGYMNWTCACLSLFFFEIPDTLLQILQNQQYSLFEIWKSRFITSLASSRIPSWKSWFVMYCSVPLILDAVAWAKPNSTYLTAKEPKAGEASPVQHNFSFFGKKKKTETNMSSKYLKKDNSNFAHDSRKKKERNSRHGRYFNLIPRQLFKVIKRFPYFLRQQICCFLPRT